MGMSVNTNAADLQFLQFNGNLASELQTRKTALALYLPVPPL
jgi:hypothetical protein